MTKQENFCVGINGAVASNYTISAFKKDFVLPDRVKKLL